ncbi:MAG: hypothetical protein A3K59_01720 [Euryarchaeota archaeon RBG_19FT_COMBO_69_17]|nr:MAG: hypothetical protein A3K59_01720 [Euryarchaeota archaeon RBG_19FT_COMBO_69_17]
MADDGPPAQDPVADGIRLFNEGYFFEAHEVLEDAWHVERGASRRFLQGLIQVCAGFHHFQNGNPSGAVALLGRGADKIREYPPDHLGVDAGGLLRDVDAARARIEGILRGEESSASVAFPTIRRRA